jgi:hypothetical protein
MNGRFLDVPVTFSIFTWSLQNRFSLASCTLWQRPLLPEPWKARIVGLMCFEPLEAIFAADGGGRVAVQSRAVGIHEAQIDVKICG